MVPVHSSVEPTAPLFETVMAPVGLALPCGMLKQRLGETQGAFGVVETARVATGSQMMLNVMFPPGERVWFPPGSTTLFWSVTVYAAAIGVSRGSKTLSRVPKPPGAGAAEAKAVGSVSTRLKA